MNRWNDKRSRVMTQEGFTVLELAVVIAAVVILVAIVVIVKS